MRSYQYCAYCSYPSNILGISLGVLTVSKLIYKSKDVAFKSRRSGYKFTTPTIKKILRKLSQLPYYVPNVIIRWDLDYLQYAVSRNQNFISRLIEYSNPIAQNLSYRTVSTRRLKRQWPKKMSSATRWIEIPTPQMGFLQKKSIYMTGNRYYAE